ncbi:thioredoxin family protein [Duganella dendranthematis]|jgi:thiol-disulfide isomerase/thioredoxin|uniref:Thioredoxin family protein n=1 Tax=Duganella dendranthematis TaxID=2728021 RepID=A0ABX6MHQ6_9BURK|nr:thioredoxin family protein [Duganella dendranthematis]QJD92492.1 thioredoxin family protein [Duganella dendranthematis]
MPSLTLNSDNREEIAAALAGDRWIVACLCAAWCGTCESYRATFDELAARHPDKLLIWIDIEDQADVVGDLDVENFPTLLIQHHELVAFFGTMLPDVGVAHRLVQSTAAQSDEELQELIINNSERADWQRNCNLRTLLRNVL